MRFFHSRYSSRILTTMLAFLCSCPNMPRSHRLFFCAAAILSLVGLDRIVKAASVGEPERVNADGTPTGGDLVVFGFYAMTSVLIFIDPLTTRGQKVKWGFNFMLLYMAMKFLPRQLELAKELLETTIELVRDIAPDINPGIF